MTIGEAISQVKLENRAYSDDSMLTDRYIWHKIRNKTILFLKQRNDKFHLNNNNFLYTVLDCVEMELVDSVTCCQEIPACKILRSKNPIPKIAESNFSSVIKGIYTLDSSQRLDFVSINDVVRLSKSKYKPSGIKAFIKNNYLFIPFKEYPKAVTIEAYFEDPLEVALVNECGAKDGCLAYQDMEWKAPSDLQGTILAEVTKEIINFFDRITTDENTDKNEQMK